MQLICFIIIFLYLFLILNDRGMIREDELSLARRRGNEEEEEEEETEEEEQRNHSLKVIVFIIVHLDSSVNSFCEYWTSETLTRFDFFS